MHAPEPLLPCSKTPCTACSLEDSGWYAPKRAARTAGGTVVQCFSLSLPVLLLVSMSSVSRRARSSASCDLMLRGQASHGASMLQSTWLMRATRDTWACLMRLAPAECAMCRLPGSYQFVLPTPDLVNLINLDLRILPCSVPWPYVFVSTGLQVCDTAR